MESVMQNSQVVFDSSGIQEYWNDFKKVYDEYF